MNSGFTFRLADAIAVWSIILVLPALSASVMAQGQLSPPVFTKSFAPAAVGPGSSSRLTFTVDNSAAAQPISDLAFSDTLPAGVLISQAPNVADGCNGVVGAPTGGSTITFAEGSVAAGSSCEIAVNIDSPTAAGTYTNVSGDLTSSAGNSGTATDDLEVVTGRPGFAKSFSENTVNINDTATLTFLIDNTANAGFESFLFFSDVLPAGLLVASPANISSTCNGVVNAESGEDSIQHNNGFVLAGESCSISVDVFADTPGFKQNISGDLNSNAGNSGFATASLQVDFEPLTKVFVNDPVIPGGTTTLEFTISNTNRDALTGISFTDDLDATLSGLQAVGALPNEPCGAGSSLTGSSVLTFTGGNLAPGTSCTFSVELQLPAGAAPGTYTNVTSEASASLGDSAVTLPATDNDLIVQFAPILTKTFLTDPVGAGGITTLEFTIENSDPNNAITDLAFEDDLAVFLSGSDSTPKSQSDICGSGSFFVDQDGSFGETFALSGGNLAAGASCTFSIDLAVPVGAFTADLTNTTSTITGTINDESVQGGPATDDLSVVGAPMLDKAFSERMVQSGQVLDLQFTLTTDPAAQGNTTEISFSDDLDVAMPGLVATSPNQTDICGSGSSISGTSTLTFTGGVLAPDSSCTFTVTVQVPADPAPGTYDNVTSDVTATAQGMAVTGLSAEDSLVISTADFVKEFTDDPVIPGSTVTLEFTITNQDEVESLSNLSFTDDLNATLSGLQATGLPQSDICGAGSQIFGTSNLTFSGGNLAPEASCTFSVTVQVPANAPEGVFGNTTSTLTGTLGENASASVAPPATDDLEVSNALTLQKTFTDDPASAGGPVTLQFVIENSSDQAITDISFTDDLDATLSGLAATGTPLSNVCGAGSQLSGNSFLTLTGGSLTARSQCTFDVALQIPTGASTGNYTNTTSAVTGLGAGEESVSGQPASDDLTITNVTFSKAFDGPAGASGQVQLTFSITNIDSGNAISGLSFTDDLDAVIPGLVATGTPLSDVCGAGSSVAGTSLLQFTGGNLPPAGSCEFSVTITVPGDAAPGSYNNTTSNLTSNGLFAADPASADLTIEPAPLFAKSFDPASIPQNGVSVLTFSIDNSASSISASSLDFTDNLPAGLVVAEPADASTTCSGGSLTAVPGSGSVSYTGGSVTAGSVCEVQVSITGSSAGLFNNTSGDLTSSSGNSGTASATLEIDQPPAFSKLFDPSVIAVDGVSTLILTIDNSAETDPASDLDFTDNLPAGLVVADPSNATITCTGGTLSATSGGSSIAYSGGSVAAGSSCQVQADVTGSSPGDYQNTSGDLTSNLGNSGPAQATLAIVDSEVLLAKAFGSSPVLPNATVEITFNVVNASDGDPIMDINFSDDLDAVVAGMVAQGLPVADVCGDGSQLSGSSTISLTGGSLPAGGSCQFSVTVQLPADAATGTYTNTSSEVTATLSGVDIDGPAASADFAVAFLGFEKAFGADSVDAGGQIDLQFTLTNPDPVNSATDIEFTDDLEAVLPGLTVLGLPQSGLCGADSTLSGTSVISLSGGSLDGGQSCVFAVTLQLPGNAESGSFSNITSPVTAAINGDRVGGAPAVSANDDFAVNEAEPFVPVPQNVPATDRWALLMLLGLMLAMTIHSRRRRQY